MKKLLLCVLGVVLPLSASASDWVAGVSYFDISEDDVSLGGIGASIGYKFQAGSNFYLIPEFSYGIGISDDDVNGGTLELDYLMGLDVRLQWNLDALYLFALPSYMKNESTFKSNGYSFSGDSDWEFGFGAGIGFNFNESMGAELSYEVVDEADIISLGLRFNF